MPVGGYGGYSPSWDIEGTWTALPAMPDADVNPLSDVLMLDDGSLVVFRWSSTNEAVGSRVVRWDEEGSRWEEVATEPFYTGTDQPWAQGGDGRIYSFETVIDPSTSTWQADPFDLAEPTEPYAGSGLDSGTDGRIYRSLSFGQLTFEIYDPLLDGRETSATLDEPFYACILRGPDHRMLAIDMTGFASYDPGLDSWSAVTRTPGDQDCFSAGFGPDGRLYMTSMWWADDIHAYDADRDAWLSVEPPPASEGFRPRFITGPDGRLWAIGQRESFVFNP